jgi:hypothetical protein
MIKSRKKRWEGHAACMGDVRNEYKMSLGRSEGNRLLEDLRPDW